MSDQVIPPSIQALVRDLEARLGRVERKRSPALAQTIIDLSAIEDDLADEIVDRVAADALKLNLTGGTLSGDLVIASGNDLLARDIRTTGGDYMSIAAGESHTYVTGLSGETVNISAEDGLRVHSSPDNWGSGWAGRDTFIARGNNIAFPATVERKAGWYGDNDSYSTGVRASTLYHTANGGRHDFDAALGTTLGRIQSGRIYTYNGADWTSLGADSTWGRLETGQDKFYINKEIQVDTGLIGSYNEDLQLQRAGVTHAYCTTTGFVFYNPDTDNDDNGTNNYLDHTAIVARTRGSAASQSIASIALWQQYSSDRHVLLRVWEGTGDRLLVNNAEGTAYIPVNASAFTVSSSARFKKRIRTARSEGGLLDYAVPANRKLAFRQLRKLRPVLFDDETQEQLTEWLGCDNPEHGERQDCTDAGCESERNTHKINHICDEYTCGGTNEVPCALIEQHIDRPGLIAEELLEVFPKAVSRQKDGTVEGIDYAVLTVELVNSIQHLLEDRDETRSLLAREIVQRRKTNRRLADIEAKVDALTNPKKGK